VVQAASAPGDCSNKEKLSFSDEALAWWSVGCQNQRWLRVLLAAGLASYLHIQATRRAERARV
jgi:hypothetical protein